MRKYDHRGVGPTETLGDLPGFEGVYVLKGTRAGHPKLSEPADMETLHVISRHRGGEVRGFERGVGDATWHVRRPNYVGAWPDLDAAVGALVGSPLSLDRPPWDLP